MTHSFISKEILPEEEAISAADIREEIFKFIQANYPGFSKESFISVNELNRFRRLYMSYLISQEKGEMAFIDRDVMTAIEQNSILSENIETDIEGEITFGQRMADRIATFGGSWSFIILFFSFIVVWIGVNVWVLAAKPFDPYPFILLNLMLSCLAAIQAPIIMMSQNRQEQKDRLRSEHDYKINLKAELEIKLLSEKIDHLLVHHNKKLLEIQELQTDYLEDLMKELKKR